MDEINDTNLAYIKQSLKPQTPTVRMTQSDNISNLIEALCAAKLEYGSVVIKNEDTRKNKAAKNANSGFGYEYADLGMINIMTTAYLASHGLTIVNMPYSFKDNMYMRTRLYHISNQWLQGEIKMILNDITSQGLGSAITYARRYLKLCLLDIAPVDDDDGLMAMQDEIGNEALKNLLNNQKKDKDNGTSQINK